MITSVYPTVGKITPKNQSGFGRNLKEMLIMEQGRAGFCRDIDPPPDKGQGALFIKQPMIKTKKLNPVIFLKNSISVQCKKLD